MSRILVPDQRIVHARERVAQATPVRDFRHLLYLQAGDAKYGEAFWIAERLKVEMRWLWHRDERLTRGEPIEHFRRRSREFWEEYEEVNRLWLPDDPVYAGVRQGIALSTTADLWTSTVGASGQHRQLEINIAGEAAASAVARVAVNRPSSNGVTPTNQTPEKFNTRSPAAVSTFATTWTTQPTLGTNDVLTLTFNAFGGSDRWVAQPGAEIYQVNGEQLSCRSRSGTSTVSGHDHWEEL